MLAFFYISFYFCILIYGLFLFFVHFVYMFMLSHLMFKHINPDLSLLIFFLFINISVSYPSL